MTGHKRQRSALLLATLFAVIFGVFAMHSLTSHERTHAGHSAIPLAAAEVDLEHGAGHEESNATASDASGSPSDDDGSGFAELCMALLCLMAALIALALSRGRSRRMLCVVPRWSAHAWLFSHGPQTLPV